MRNVLDTINHPKATPEKIKQMKDNGWTDQEIAEKFAYMEKVHNHIDASVGRAKKFLENQMKTFQRYFREKTSEIIIDKYIKLVLKTVDPDDEVEIYYDFEEGMQKVKIRVLDRIIN